MITSAEDLTNLHGVPPLTPATAARSRRHGRAPLARRHVQAFFVFPPGGSVGDTPTCTSCRPRRPTALTC